jgi:GNAT superfamily N-acetyltransferase
MSTSGGQAFSIASATANDCSECARLLIEQLAEHGVDASAEQLSSVLEKIVVDAARGFVLVARENGQLVGIAYVATILSAEHCGLVGWLEELYVRQSHRSCGIGTALVTAIIERAHNAHMVAIDLEIDEGRSRAESLYRRSGFRLLNRSRWVKRLTT